MTDCKKTPSCSTPNSSLQVIYYTHCRLTTAASFKGHLFKKMKNLNVTFPVFFSPLPLQEQAAIPETSTMPA